MHTRCHFFHPPFWFRKLARYLEGDVATTFVAVIDTLGALRCAPHADAHSNSLSCGKRNKKLSDTAPPNLSCCSFCCSASSTCGGSSSPGSIPCDAASRSRVARVCCSRAHRRRAASVGLRGGWATPSAPCGMACSRPLLDEIGVHRSRMACRAS